MEMNHCRRCGSALTGTHGAFVCANGHTLYSNPAPTVGVFLLTPSRKVILSVRGIDPGRGGLDTIGGFVDDDESFEQAIIREILEETGLRKEQYSSLTYLTSAPSTYEFGGESRNVLTCFYHATLLPGAEAVAADDVAELVTIAPGDIVIDDMWSNDTRIAAEALLKVIT